MNPVDRLVAWVKGNDDRVFEVRYIGGLSFPWSVELADDALSWSVTADSHDDLSRAVDHALELAAKETAARA